MTSLEQLQEWMSGKENEHVEFKEAKNLYDREKLMKYCVALANERGGKFILGVTDAPPRRVVGSSAFHDVEKAKIDLLNRLRFRVDIEEVQHPDGRVVIFHVPSRLMGEAKQFDGAYLMRSGESLTGMTVEMLQAILAETTPDFSAEVCTKATLADLNPEAIENFRTRWLRKSQSSANAQTLQNAARLRTSNHSQLLEDAELIIDGGITYAALILFGTRQAIGKYLAQSEIVFEYRSTEASGPAADREEYREGFFTFYDPLWDRINLRNDRQPFRERLFVLDIPTFNEQAIREAVLNAVSHRDYRLGGSTFIRQYARRIEFVSPGGFLPGITAANILDRQLPRNRRLADAFLKCGLVERSGQGMNLIYENCIKESKPRPDFKGTDDFQVSLTLSGDIQDTRFLQFLEKVGAERLNLLSTQDLMALDSIHRERRVSTNLKPHLPALVDAGVVEPAGHGRYTLSRQFYDFLGERGTYTRKRGLDHETNKALILKHITENNQEGSPMRHLKQVLPSFSPRQILLLLDELRREKKVHPEGLRSKARWYLGAEQSLEPPV